MEIPTGNFEYHSIVIIEGYANDKIVVIENMNIYSVGFHLHYFGNIINIFIAIVIFFQ